MTTLNYSYFHSSAYINKVAQFAKLRDCFGGVEQVKDAGTAYLPKPGGMADEHYTAYKQRAMFYPVTERTVRGLLGVVFRTPPVFKLPNSLKPWEDAMTPEGDSLLEGYKVAVREVLHMGRFGMLLDLPEDVPVNTPPFLAQYMAENITAWERKFYKGHRRLTRVMLRDYTDSDGADIGRFLELILDLTGPTPVYRSIRWMVKFSGGGATQAPEVTVLEKQETVPVVNGKEVGYIPFYFMNTYTNKPELEKSPVLDLVDANLSHYTLQADYRQALFMLAQPTPYIIGDLDEKQVPKKIGAGAFWVLPAETQDIGMLEFSGAGIGALHEGLTQLEEYMAALGAKLVHRQSNPETAEAVKVMARDELSVVESAVLSVRDGFRAACRDAAEWTGATRASVSVEADTDFPEGKMDPAMLGQLVATWQQGGISRVVYHRNLQRGDIMPPSRTVEDEIAATEQEAQERQEKAAEAMAAQAAAAGDNTSTDGSEDDPAEDTPGKQPKTGGKPPQPKGKP